VGVAKIKKEIGDLEECGIGLVAKVRGVGELKGAQKIELP
jgi:hypothetical protein